MGQEGSNGDKGELGLKGKEGLPGNPGLTGVRVSICSPSQFFLYTKASLLFDLNPCHSHFVLFFLSGSRRETWQNWRKRQTRTKSNTVLLYMLNK